GFAGLTHPAGGAPIPCRLLISEMVRLECTFSFVRRSFRRDAQRYGVAEVVRALREEIEATRERSHAELLANRNALASLVEVSV
ncbi:MAG TPA: hypothetical protein VF701_02675, partial [Thermoanaerobaculia bacterium]